MSRAASTSGHGLGTIRRMGPSKTPPWTRTSPHRSGGRGSSTPFTALSTRCSPTTAQFFGARRMVGWIWASTRSLPEKAWGQWMLRGTGCSSSTWSAQPPTTPSTPSIRSAPLRRRRRISRRPATCLSRTFPVALPWPIGFSSRARSEKRRPWSSCRADVPRGRFSFTPLPISRSSRSSCRARASLSPSSSTTSPLARTHWARRPPAPTTRVH
mmetsp:Transcript_105449/g.339538  ORF Transcript_105449/g.339538 Transcript_105449/m.339538 type:complete len:213 (+) Transcript_105449:858-1496(+)